LEINKKEIEKLIEISKKDTFFNHLWNIISRDFSANGEVKQNEIKVWRQNFWNITIYPIFIFKFDSRNHLINITSKLNPVGKLFNGLIALSFIFFVFPKNTSDFEILENWKILCLIILIVLLATYFAYKVYSFEKRNQLEQIYEILDIEIEESNNNKERTITKVMTRVLLYPFCIGLIILAVFHLIPTGEIILAIGSLAISGTYLFSDIKILLARKTTGNIG